MLWILDRVMVKISKRNYDRSVKYTEIIILILFTSSAVLMSISQDKLMKSNDFILTNIGNFEKSLISGEFLTQSLISHLIDCNVFDLSKDINGTPDQETIKMIEEAKQTCLFYSMNEVNESLEIYSNALNKTLDYKINSDILFNKYRKDSERLSQYAIILFILGLILCFFLVLDLIIFEPEP